MTQAALTTYMQRAGIRSNRELSALTGIRHSMMDAIVNDPGRARLYQLRLIADACGMTADEIMGLIRSG